MVEAIMSFTSYRNVEHKPNSSTFLRCLCYLLVIYVTDSYLNYSTTICGSSVMIRL